MRLEQRIFLAASILCSLVTSLTAYSIYSSVKIRMVLDYQDRYLTLASTVGNTLTQLDVASDRFMTTSLDYVASRINVTSGLPSNEFLKRLRAHIGSTSIDVIRNDGSFVRSSSFPEYGSLNLFTYCSRYREIFNAGGKLLKVPIMPSPLFGKGIKFSLLSLPGVKYALNVGFELDFIGQTLKNALIADPALSTVGLYTPSGKKLGEYAAKEGRLIARSMPETLVSIPLVRLLENQLEITSRVTSAILTCCECQRRGLVVMDKDEYHYLLRMNVSLDALNKSVSQLRAKILSILLVSLILSLMISKLLARAFVRKINLINQRANAIVSTKQISGRLNLPGNDELAVMAQNFDTMLGTLEEAQKELLISENHKIYASVASQVSHDIRSPLTALQLLLKQKSLLPEEHRILAGSAINRITDIANTLLQRSKDDIGVKHENLGAHQHQSVEHLPTALCSIISEKRLSLEGQPSISIELDFGDAYGCFAMINDAEFKRTISNLVNNSCESLANDKGTVKICIAKCDDSIVLTIADSGRGIPTEILSRLGEKGLTYGKGGSSSGCGLGVYSAIHTIEKFGGHINFKSSVDIGTCVTISLPLSGAPAWFMSGLQLQGVHTVVSIDDDSSIHEVWADRLKVCGFLDTGGKQVSFRTVADFNIWLKCENPVDLSTNLFLVDFDLQLSDGTTGLDLIDRARLANSAVLVTNRDEDPLVRSQCERLGVRLIPKSMATIIPIDLST